jgi:hypothetical protein
MDAILPHPYLFKKQSPSEQATESTEDGGLNLSPIGSSTIDAPVTNDIVSNDKTILKAILGSVLFLHLIFPKKKTRGARLFSFLWKGAHGKKIFIIARWQKILLWQNFRSIRFT